MFSRIKLLYQWQRTPVLSSFRLPEHSHAKTNMTDKFHVLEYEPDDKGCPYYLSERATPKEWEWDGYDTKPFDVKITKNYSSKITDKDINFIDFDLYRTDSPYVSDKFVALCKELSVSFRAIPIDITMRDGSRPEKTYFVFLPASYISLIDVENSIFEIERLRENGDATMHRDFPDIPVYSKIENFRTKDIEAPHLFQCIDIFSLVCTDVFKIEALKRNLRGLKFTPLDETYIYDPWAGW